MEHFSHRHPLLLSDHQEQQNGDDGEEISCSGCCLPLSSSGGGGGATYYNCMQCKYFLHKSCAELPHKIRHFEHPRHPLVLDVSSLNLHHSRNYPYCDCCGEQILGFRFTYHCSLCDFNIDIKCASLLHMVDQAEDHEHSFMLLKPLKNSHIGYGQCDACGKEIKGMSYLCSTCQFRIHECCLTITKTIKLRVHPHQLDYSYFEQGNRVCHICNSKIEKTFSFYSCSICRYTIEYTAHFWCALSEEDLRDVAFVLKDENQEPFIPKTNYTYYKRDSSTTINLEENQIATVELKHFTHPHLLVLGKNDLDCEKKYCEGCSWPIFDLPFYTCSQCNSHLHKACAELPHKISHQLHRHPLTLCFDEPNEVNIHRTFKCNGCETICNGFAYSCDECNFSIDVRCSLFTAIIGHESHQHSLHLSRAIVDKFSCPCTGCDEDGKVLFRCESGCNFQLDLRCATLPYTPKHRCPKHNWEFYPIQLTYGSEEGDTYYCDICEEERHWKKWFYYCEDCDYSAHPSCILSNCPNKSKRF